MSSFGHFVILSTMPWITYVVNEHAKEAWALQMWARMLKANKVEFPNLFLILHQVDPTYPNLDAHLLAIGRWNIGLKKGSLHIFSQPLPLLLSWTWLIPMFGFPNKKLCKSFRLNAIFTCQSTFLQAFPKPFISNLLKNYNKMHDTSFINKMVLETPLFHVMLKFPSIGSYESFCNIFTKNTKYSK
jgi:hypothetical protein